MAKKIGKEVLLQQTVQKTELLSQTQTYRKNVIYSLTLDNTESMRLKKRAVLLAAEKIFNKLGDHDRMEFALFGRNYQKAHGPLKKKYIDWEQDKGRFLCDEGSTALLDAICAAIDQFPRDAKYKNRDKVIVILTDGEDNVSRTSFDMMIEKLRSFSIPNCKFYLIGVQLSERAKAPYRVISTLPNCTFLEADQVDQIAAAFKIISKTIFIKRTTTIHANSPPGLNNNNNRISNANDEGLGLVPRKPSTFVTVTTTIVKEPCSFFAKGNCKYGDSCKYSHGISVPVNANSSNHYVPQVKPAPTVKACTFFSTPSGCAKGSHCPFSHAKPKQNGSNHNNNNNNNNNNRNNNNNNNNNNNRNQNQNKKRGQ